MPRRTIATVAALIGTATIGLVVVLWWAGTAGLSGAALVTARFDALRTGLSIGIGGGGIFALYLAWRRQHATEIGLAQKERDQADVALAYELQRDIAEHNRQHSERVAATTERDAEARRITDLYAKSVEQLGSDKAPVRHGGLYALERLAQDHPDNPALRQTVVNVICAYLRSPFETTTREEEGEYRKPMDTELRERVQEQEVRLTAQRILTSHLTPGNDPQKPVTTFWHNIDLDLTAATLINFNLSDAMPRDAIFQGASFEGESIFRATNFTGKSTFEGCRFAKYAEFTGSTFAEIAEFNQVIFGSQTEFAEVKFKKSAHFNHSRFDGPTSFDNSHFGDIARFLCTLFHYGAWFNRTTFSGEAIFAKSSFRDGARFENCSFARHARFDQATFSKHAWFNDTKFQYDTSFSNVTFNEDAQSGRMSLSEASESGADLKLMFGKPTFIERTLPTRAEAEEAGDSNQMPLTESVRFDGAAFSSPPSFISAIFRHNPADYAINFSSWPRSWQPTREHTAIEGLEGTWHYIVNTATDQDIESSNSR